MTHKTFEINLKRVWPIETFMLNLVSLEFIIAEISMFIQRNITYIFYGL